MHVVGTDPRGQGFDSDNRWKTMSNQASTRRAVYYVFIFLLAALFALEWGPGSKGCNKTQRTVTVDPVATANGRPIPAKDFVQLYGQQVNMMRRQGLPPEFAKQLGMDKQIIEALVTNELLAQAAESRGVTVSDEELVDTLSKQPDFQREGSFDPELYKQIVRDYAGMTEVAYEKRERRRMASQRLLELVEQGAVVSDDEVKSRYAKEANWAKASFVSFTPAMYANKVPSAKPGEVEAWAAAHDQEISAWYEQNRISYFVPEKAKARQILIRVEREATDDKKNEARAKAEALRRDLVDSKKPFAEVASAASEDEVTREKGGDLGWVERMQLPGDFAEKLFALKPGEVTPVVESPLGFHVGILEEKKPSEQKSLDGVRLEIAGQLAAREKASRLARAEAERALEQVKKGAKLADLYPASDTPSQEMEFAAETKPRAKESGEFNASVEAIPQLGAAPDALKAVFARTSPGVLDGVQSVGDAVAVIVVDERHTASDEDFTARRGQLKVEALKAKQFEVRESFKKSLAQSGTVVKNEKVIATLLTEG